LIKSLFLIPQNDIAMFASANAVAIKHLTHEDTPIADLTRMSHIQENPDSALEKLITADDGDMHALYIVGAVHNATIDAVLTALAYSMTVMILEPVNVGAQKGFLDLLKFGLTNNSLNFFHNTDCLFVFSNSLELTKYNSLEKIQGKDNTSPLPPSRRA